MPRSSRPVVGALFLLLLLGAGAHPARGATQCSQGCAAAGDRCSDAARAAYAGLAPSCSGAGTCLRQARHGLRRALTACRRLEGTSCRRCCATRDAGSCLWRTGHPLAAEPQAAGDPVRGRRELLSGDYMTCGIPYKLWTTPALRPAIAGGFGGGSDAPRIPDRDGKNADLPYFLNVFTAGDGAEVVNANCLLCHGGTFDGRLVVGLGNATADFTRGAGGGAAGIPLTDQVIAALGLTAAEEAQLRKVFARGAVLAPSTAMRTIGMNPAEMFAVTLMVHHDRDTLAWSDAPLTPLVVRDRDGRPIPDPRVTSDPPPWWRVHKKNALFYNGMARGDHRGTMALATSVCVDDVARARQVDAAFKDLQAYVRSIEAPTYGRRIDARLAARGQRVFERTCAGCHGSYASRDEYETYPNLLIPLGVIGTDPVVAEAGVVHSPELVTWYNRSFYGEITRMEPNDPFPGYMPPPLDGIWATAPFLHNGSVPTVELVLNSRARPASWKRVDLDDTHFDETALGWPWAPADPAAATSASERARIYDTTQWSQSNAGHTFGDGLTRGDRRAVIEYLKTL